MNKIFFLVFSINVALSSCRSNKPNALNDREFDFGSKIGTIKLDSSRTTELEKLGILWGYIKYYHPNVAKGQFNMDAALFRVLPNILTAKNADETNIILEKWLDDFGVTDSNQKSDDLINSDSTKEMPDLKYLFETANFPKSLLKKLNYIRHTRPTSTNDHYYLTSPDTVRINFEHEITYNQFEYPDCGLRLLSLFRFWNAAHYYYAYRHLIGKDDYSILSESIPEFCNASNALEYQLAVLKLIASYHDSNTNIWNFPIALERARGNHLIPYAFDFIENKLVVTKYSNHNNVDPTGERLLSGDIIEKMDEETVESLVRKYLPYSPGSSQATQLAYLVSPFYGFLSRSNSPKRRLEIQRNGVKLVRLVTGFDATTNGRIDFSEVDYEFPNPSSKEFKLISPTIGYINTASINKNSIDSVKALFKNTKGIIIDCRSKTASDVSPYLAWLKEKATPFATYTLPSIKYPGYYELTNAQLCGQTNPSPYNGKLVVLVDLNTSYRSETNAMMLATVSRAKIIGEPTAGTNGIGSMLILPGGLKTSITTVGIQYPDSTEIHGCGIKIDSIMHPTIQGIREGRDELLEAAIKILNK